MATLRRPLEGVKVVELATFIAAPPCARYLADLGAQAVKAEAPGGDPLRCTAINEGRPTGDLENICFDVDNANKFGICLDTKTPEGREALEKLIAGAGVFVTNVRHNSLVKSGLDYDTLKVNYPRLVMGCVTGYGETGPDKDLPGFDFTAFFARGGILAALYRARETGRGDKVTVSLFHSALWAVAIMLQGAQYGAEAANYPMSRRDIANSLAVVHKTKDGRWIQFAAPAYNATCNRFVTALGRPDLVDGPRYYPQVNLQEHLHEFYDLLVEQVAQKTLDEWVRGLQAGRHPLRRGPDLAGAPPGRAGVGGRLLL